MRKIMLSLFATVIFFTFINGSMGDEFTFGKLWLNMSSNSRVNWVWGVAAGQELILEELQMKSTAHLKYLISVNESDVIAEIITNYYNDSANTYIPWKYMTFIANMKLKGESATKIEKELESLRKYATYLREQRQK